MQKNKFSEYKIDSSSIVFLSQFRKDHTNSYRFSITLKEAVCPVTLQKAVDRIYPRFPSVIAGFHPGFFHFSQVPVTAPPQVQPDPGLLRTMTKEELHSCAYRVYYRDCTIIAETFHALADGFGAIACITTLTAEYLRLKHNIQIPVHGALMDVKQNPSVAETEDAYMKYGQGKPLHLPSRYSYLLPGGEAPRGPIHTHTCRISTQDLLDAAHRYGVSITVLLSSLMATSVMEVQKQHLGTPKHPVRIMVPVDLRRMFPSRTFRNFVLYALPTMEPQESGNPLSEIVHSFAQQLRSQIDDERFASIMAYNVKTQKAWYFRILPLFLKQSLMRLICHFFGESNSCMTLTNLGNVTLPEEMLAYADGIDVILTPRMRSPYNCGIISCNGQLSINISRFPQDSALEEVFMRNLCAALKGEAV